MGRAKDWKDAMRGRIPPDDIAALFVRNGYVPLRFRTFGAAPDTLECDGLSAIVADRVGYDRAYRAWADMQIAAAGVPFQAAIDAHWKARSADIGITRIYALGYQSGWDGRKQVVAANPAEQTEFDRGYDDGAAGIAAVKKALGTEEPKPAEVCYVVEDQAVS